VLGVATSINGIKEFIRTLTSSYNAGFPLRIIDFVIDRDDDIFTPFQETSLVETHHEIHQGDMLTNEHVDCNSKRMYWCSYIFL
jgi:hypothetical protein